MPINLPTAQKPVEWVGSALEDLKEFPLEVRSEVGHAIFTAQIGGKHPSAKPLTGDKAFKGAGVLEIVEDYDGNTYRAVYTIRFQGVVYVLHAFQKKSKKGISTPKEEIERIKRRLAVAQAHYEEKYRVQDTG